MKYLSQFLQRTDSLSRIRLTVSELASLTRRIRAALPADFADHVVGCAPGPGTVVILIDSAAWASQLRYARRDILSACQNVLGERIRDVQFKLLPVEPSAPPRSAPELSSAARHLLRQTADGVTDEALANALRRLGRDDDQDD